MYHMIASEYAAHLGRRQDQGERELPPERTNFAAPDPGSVQCRQQETDLSGAYSLAHLFETADGETSAAGKTDSVAAALRQQPFYAICQSRRHDDRGTHRACKQASRDRPLDQIAPRCQPQAPAGQDGSHIGHELAAWSYDEAQQLRALGDFTCCDAAAERPRGGGPSVI